ncbi:MAG: hypoxanthine phosphoribosyltransferase [Massilibacteroides sp.]|nr:hypoxanthine phosphoribosyltransferase [Massilibacteroides sp.]
METIRIKDKAFKPYIPEAKVKTAIANMAKEIKKDIEGKDPLFTCILNGSFMFVADLMKELDGTYEMAFARYSSYQGTDSTGKVREIMPLKTNIKGRTIFLLEDIVETGTTMRFVMDKLRSQGAAEVKLATMLYKPTEMCNGITPDYVAMEISNEFIVGYGLDYDGFGRGLKDIYQICDK